MGIFFRFRQEQKTEFKDPFVGKSGVKVFQQRLVIFSISLKTGTTVTCLSLRFVLIFCSCIQTKIAKKSMLRVSTETEYSKNSKHFHFGAKVT